MSKEKNFEDGVWRTVGGRRIFIRNGQGLSEAMIASGKFKPSGSPKPSKVTHLGKLKDNSPEARQEALYSYMKELDNLDHEVAITILKNGEIIKVESQEEAAIRDYVQQIGKANLKNADMIHNHPAKVTQYTFSDADLGVFCVSEMNSMVAFDDKYVYYVNRNAYDIDSYIQTVGDMDSLNGDEFSEHFFIQERCRQNGIGYRRKER